MLDEIRELTIRAEKLATKSSFATLHNFVKLYLDITSGETHGSLLDLLEELGNPRQVVLEVAVKHFRQSTRSKLLARGLRIVLGCFKTDDVDVVQEKFFGSPTKDKYLNVCHTMTELLSPISPDADSDMMMRKLSLATECVFRAVQVCQEWDYPGKAAVDSVYDYVR